jgi:hypothetical protein
MIFKEFIQHMRNALTPRNPDWVNRADYDIVKMGIHSNHGYMDGATVREAINFFETRSITASSLGEKLNPLESLGAVLLMESAYLMDEIKREGKTL